VRGGGLTFNAGIVNSEIQAAESFNGLINHLGNIAAVGDVAFDKSCFAAERFDLLKRLAVVDPIRYHYFRATLCERDRSGLANAEGATRYDGYLVFKYFFHSHSK
jgi:hypothetical protein